MTRKPSFDLSALSKDIKPQSEKSRKLSTALFARSYDAAVMPSHSGESIDGKTINEKENSNGEVEKTEEET